MAIFFDFAIGGNFPGFAFATSGAALEVTSVTSTRAELRNPVTGAVTVLTGTGLAAAAGGAAAPVTGTMTGFEVRVPDGAGTVPTLQATGLLWSAAEFLGAARDAASLHLATRLDALFSLQPITYDARDAVQGVDFGFRGAISDFSLTGSDFGDTLRGGIGNDTIRGGDGDDLILPGANTDGALIDAGTGFDTVSFHFGIGDPVHTRHVLSHRSLEDRTGIVVTLFDDREKISVIDKGSFGQTQLADVWPATYGRGGLTIEGTALDDRFDLSLGFGFVNLVPGRGSDTVVATGGGRVGLDFATDSNGIAATQSAVVDLVTGIVADDGFGFADTLDIASGITVSVTLTEWADNLVVREGHGSLRGGGGTDTLDYGQSVFAAGVRVDLASGTLAGASYGLIVEGFENLIGTRDHDDHLSGTRGANVIDGLGGDDTIYGDVFRAAYASPQAAQVWRLYQMALHRAPDPVGLNDWTERLIEGSSTVRQVAEGILGSSEFYRSHADPANFVFAGHLYRTVLERSYEPSEVNHWESYVPGERRPDLTDVLLGFSESREFANKTRAEAAAFAAVPTDAAWTDDVFRLYQATLGRAPDAEGLLNWLGRLGSGMPFLTAVEGFTGRRAFQNTYSGLDDTAFVRLLYENVLNRAADAAGLADWTGRMAGGMTRAEVVAGFAQSREFVNDTAEAVTDFVRGFGGGDTLDGGAGDNRLWGGMLADAFVFDADDMAHHRVMDFEAWDRLVFRDFGYDDAFDIRRHMTQSGTDVVFQDQSVTVTLSNTQLAAITDDSLSFF